MSEVDRLQNNPDQTWQQADARVLGQILAAQNIVFALPDTARIAEFYAQTLISIPGITACRVCLGDRSVLAGEMEGSVCAECEAVRHLAGEDNPLTPANSNVQCSLADQPDMRAIAINSYQHHFGSFVVKIKQAAVFEVYQPFISNLSNHVALILENRRQKGLLQAAHAELERKVEERTHDLTVANEALDAARLAALTTMHAAIEARQRAEQANADLQREVSERQRVEEALRLSEERFRRLAENARDVIYRMSLPDGKYEYVSPAVQAVFGYSPEECYASPLLIKQTLHPDWQVYYREQWTNLLEGKMPPTYEYQIIHKSGQVRWLNQRNILVRDNAGTPIAIEGIVTDITERRRAEEEIRRLNQGLEQRVADRTAQLEAANKELEAFAYSVSHDLRAPLRHIDGYLELLQHRATLPADEQSQHYLATIASSARRMGQLIDDLLSFSRMGRHDLARQAVELNSLVQDVIRDFEPETRDRTIQWRIADLPVVTGDRAMLRVVLVNLISNALKFTRSRSQADIEIGYEAGATTGPVFFIRDNGVGFDMAYVDKLFGVFQRLHRVDEFEGTGIGLANVRRIISRHGGQTWAEGAVDHGATFYFSLPQFTPEG